MGVNTLYCIESFATWGLLVLLSIREIDHLEFADSQVPYVGAVGLFRLDATASKRRRLCCITIVIQCGVQCE